MKTEDKKTGAGHLLDAIGQIDDKIIFDSQNSKKFKKKNKIQIIYRIVAVASVFVFAVGIVGGSFALNKVFDKNANDGMSDCAPLQSLEVILNDAVNTGMAESVSYDSIDFFDNNVNIIWGYGEEDDEYYRLCIDTSSNAEKKINNALNNPKELTDEAQSSDISVWISYGNGMVVSPYLKNNNGNIGYSVLFEYSPEVVPSVEFIYYIKNIIN